MKKVLIILCFLILIYIIFIFIEIKRFNNSTKIEPLILIDQDKIDLTSEEGMVNKKYIGLGYTIEYEFFVDKKENNENTQVDVVSGEFRLFDKILLSAWIQ
ncbi:MAG: hypothetical protein PHH51_03455 [Bacilli bacterium]|nr:hypothetical protein [Bacilli bacterium]